jgi:hypothetical protein
MVLFYFIENSGACTNLSFMRQKYHIREKKPKQVLSILQSHFMGKLKWSEIGFVKFRIGNPTRLKNLFFDKSSLTCGSI